MSITKYDYSVLEQKLLVGLNDFLTPVWNWTKIEKTENLQFIFGSNYPYIKFYVDDNTALCFAFNRNGNSQSNMKTTFKIQTTSAETFISSFDIASSSIYDNNSSFTTRIRFTKVGTDGFLLGTDGFTGASDDRNGDYTCPLIMCCKVGSKYALVHNSLNYTQPPTMPLTTANKIFYDGMTANETVSLSRRVSENGEQLIPVCTISGVYSKNGFIPIMTYNDTLTPQQFTLNGKIYYGNGLMVLLDE